MKRYFHLGLMMLALAFALPALVAQDQAADTGAPKLTWNSEVVGRVVRVDGKRRILTIAVDPIASRVPLVPKDPPKSAATKNPQSVEKNPPTKAGGLSAEQKGLIARLQVEVQQRYQAALRARPGPERVRAAQAYQEARARLEAALRGETPPPPPPVDNPRNDPRNDANLQQVDFVADANVVVRAIEPPPAFDEKGNFKVYSPEELDKLRGPDRRIPGYPANFSSVRPGVNVRLFLVAASPAAAAAKEEEKKGKNRDTSGLQRAVMIYIMDRYD
jgi:hypothetical protein